MAERENTNSVQQGKVIAVCSAKGGIGKTLISVNLAVAINKKNLNVCIVDGDFQFGDVSVAMDISPTFTIKDIVEELDGITEDTLSDYLSSHSSGVAVLSAPERPEFADLITSEFAIKIIQLLRNKFDYIIIDSGAGFHGTTLDIMEISDEILIITNLEMTALKNTKLILETLNQLELLENTQLIVNRYTMESLIRASDVPKMLGQESVINIPNNFKLASQSLNLGIPFVMNQSKSDLAKAVFLMAENLVSEHGEKRKGKEKKSVMKKLFT